jgi:O-methyltransferase
MLKKFVRSTLVSLGYEIRRLPKRDEEPYNIPDGDLYRPMFSPWFGRGEFARFYKIAAPKNIVCRESCYVLWTLLRQSLNICGDVWECGVYKGGTAAMLAATLRNSMSTKKLFLFDTFEGMPETDPEKDWHKQGDFRDASAEAVTRYVGAQGSCIVRKGLIPDTFRGLDSAKIAFAHIDVDIYKSIYDCVTFIWPRLTLGGFIVFDDYGAPTCPGARAAVDEFFATEACVPLCFSTGQAVIFKGVAESPLREGQKSK